jgi:hypothetical protein
MSISYTWFIPKDNSIFTSNTAGQNNVITTIRYEISANDGTNTATRMGSTNFTYKQGDPFTPFENLTESQLIGWIQNSIGSNKISTIQTQLARELNNMANPPVRPTIQSVPWK